MKDDAWKRTLCVRFSGNQSLLSLLSWEERANKGRGCERVPKATQFPLRPKNGRLRSIPLHPGPYLLWQMDSRIPKQALLECTREDVHSSNQTHSGLFGPHFGTQSFDSNVRQSSRGPRGLLCLLVHLS